MKTKHYMDKNANVYGYKPSGIAVTEMSESLFQEFKKNPIGGKWTLKGWVIDQEKLAKHKRAEKESQIKKHTEEMNIALLTDDTETAKFHAQQIKELRK